jgi:hypothetical protein
MRIQGFDEKTALPSAELKHAIVRDSLPDVLQVRRQRDDISGVERREVGDAKSGLLSLEVVPESINESTPKEYPCSCADDESQKADE